MLQIKHVSKSYGSLPVVEDISFEVKSNQIVTLIGPSGCGKTTLLRMISGLEMPDSGEIEKNSDRFSYIFQEDRLLPWKSVRDNIRIVRKDPDEASLLELIHVVGLSGFENYLPSQLSGGMKKRCGIARAFYYMRRPSSGRCGRAASRIPRAVSYSIQGDLLLMDEPFQGLDLWMKHEMIQLLLRLWQSPAHFETHRRGQEKGCILVTHDIDEALQLSDCIHLLTGRPARIQKTILLPPRGDCSIRDLHTPEMNEIRADILRTLWNETKEKPGSTARVRNAAPG